MPTMTFYNLPVEKREKLLCAIRDEFSRVPFDQVSINQIIKGAGISRGSFYQYFTDKIDMLNYILSDYRDKMLTCVKESLDASGGQIIQLFIDMFDFAVNFVMEEKVNSFCKNLFADVKINSGLFTRQSKDEAISLLLKELIHYSKLKTLDLRTDKDLFYIVDILAILCREAIAEAFLNTSQYQRTRKNFLAKLELLKRGFMKNKEEMPECWN